MGKICECVTPEQEQQKDINVEDLDIENNKMRISLQSIKRAACRLTEESEAPLQDGNEQKY